jgi:hypothetical protein
MVSSFTLHYILHFMCVFVCFGTTCIAFAAKTELFSSTLKLLSCSHFRRMNQGRTVFAYKLIFTIDFWTQIFHGIKNSLCFHWMASCLVLVLANPCFIACQYPRNEIAHKYSSQTATWCFFWSGVSIVDTDLILGTNIFPHKLKNYFKHWWMS